MADYYPLLAKALANLPSRSAPSARRVIYDRARKALIGQLRSIQPPMSEEDIAKEDTALDLAIARLETEYGAPPATSPPTPRPESPPAASAKTPAPPPTPAAAPKPAPAPAPAAQPPRPATPPPGPSSTQPPKPPLSPPSTAARRPTLGATPGVGATAAPAIDAVEPAASAARAASNAPPLAAHRGSAADEGGAAPVIVPSEPSALTIPPALKAGADVARPVAPGRDQPRRRGPWLLVTLVLLAIAAGAAALAAYLWREAPAEVAAKPPVEASEKPAPEPAVQNQSKIVERVDAGGQTTAAAPATAETPIPTVTVPVAPIPAQPARPAEPAQTAAAGQNPAAQAPAATTTPAATLPIASRAAMLIGVPNDPQKPAVYLGNAVWSVIPPTNPGQPATLAVRIDIDVPDQKMKATVTIRKNSDASLPATHTLDLRTTFADGAEIKGIKDMGLPQLRKDTAPTGDALSGVRVKINDAYYLVGLTRSDADAAHNLDLLSNDNWIDFPLLLNDDRIAKLTFEKGGVGDQVMAQALNAWK